MCRSFVQGREGSLAVSRQPISFRSLAALVAAFILPCAHATTVEYTIDPDHTVVSFEARIFGISVQLGRLHGASGTVALDADAGSGRIDIVVDARSIETGNETMAKVLRGQGLLNVEQYPEIVYRAERVVFANGEPERIEGELTLLGVTRSVPLVVDHYGCTRDTLLDQQRCVIEATATFKRSAFGMTRYTFFTSDEVKLAIRAEGGARTPLPMIRADMDRSER
jgi:polyisoprenoid-binding protein YceI